MCLNFYNKSNAIKEKQLYHYRMREQYKEDVLATKSQVNDTILKLKEKLGITGWIGGFKRFWINLFTRDKTKRSDLKDLTILENDEKTLTALYPLILEDLESLINVREGINLNMLKRGDPIVLLLSLEDIERNIDLAQKKSYQLQQEQKRLLQTQPKVQKIIKKIPQNKSKIKLKETKELVRVATIHPRVNKQYSQSKVPPKTPSQKPDKNKGKTTILDILEGRKF